MARPAPSHDAVFTALQRLLVEHGWEALSLARVAEAAGVSRQTIYKRFGSRAGLAEGYAMHLADRFCDLVEDAARAHEDDPRAGVEASFGAFLAEAARDPLVRALQVADAPTELIGPVLSDGGPVFRHSSERLAAAYSSAWLSADPEAARLLAETGVRLCLGLIAMPPASPELVARDLATLFAPFIAAHAAAPPD